MKSLQNFIIMMILTACNVSQISPPSPSQTKSVNGDNTNESTTPTDIVIPITPDSTSLSSEIEILKNRGFLLGQPCVAPCFLGITPGETNIDDAMGLMGEYFNSSNCKIDNSVFECYKPESALTIAASDPQTGLIVEISYTPYFSPPILLEDIILQYGDPDFVHMWAPPDELILSRFDLFFDAIQTIIVLEEYYGEESNQIMTTSKVEDFLFLAKEEYVEAKESMTDFPWKGYGTYP